MNQAAASIRRAPPTISTQTAQENGTRAQLALSYLSTVWCGGLASVTAWTSAAVVDYLLKNILGRFQCVYPLLGCSSLCTVWRYGNSLDQTPDDFPFLSSSQTSTYCLLRVFAHAAAGRVSHTTTCRVSHTTARRESHATAGRESISVIKKEI